MTGPPTKQPLVQVCDLVKYFRIPGSLGFNVAGAVRAVDHVSFEVYPGEVFGLVGESGCGKTTLGRLLLNLIPPTSGQVIFDDHDLTTIQGKQLRSLRQQMQIVFQDPLASLDPRMRVLDIVAEPLRTHRVVPAKEIREVVLGLLRQGGLGEHHLDRFPHEMSGGQCQRVAIARALALQPRLIVLDEPTSALDVSVQAQIINLLDQLRQEHQLTYVFITHDLSVVQHLSHRIGVMYLGKMVEIGESEAIFAEPLHPYTQALLSAIPMPEVGKKAERIILKGNVPSPANPPPGCRFHTRCPLAQAICNEKEPLLREVKPGRSAACHFVF